MNKPLHLLWLTENYYPATGGMAESCDRIVHNLRLNSVKIDVLHLSSRASHFQESITQNGKNWAFPLESDASHSLNLVWNYLQNHSESSTWTHLVAFGGFLPILSAPLFSAWLNIPLLTLWRGNDFDTAIFNPSRQGILKEALLKSSAVCAVSQDKTFKIKQLYPDISVFYTPNGIDLNQWKIHESDRQKAEEWRKTHIADNQRLIGVFGQLKAKKGILFFLNALGMSGLLSKFHLLFVGDLSPELLEFLSLHQDKISFTHLPFMEKYSLLPYYAACDAVAIPSFYDGMPNVLLEAGGLAVPIIAANTAGMQDVLAEKNLGFLFKVGDVKDCMRAIYEFSETTNVDLKIIGENLQKHIQENFTHQQETERYLKILRQNSIL